MDSESKHSGTVGCLRTAGILVLILLLLGAILVSVWVVQESNDRKLVKAKLDELSRRGVPIDNASLAAWYRSNTDSTDTQAWEKILSEVSSKEFTEWTLGIEAFDTKAVGAGWTETGWTGESAERNLVAKTVDLRRRIHELVKKRSPVQFIQQFDGLNTLLPQVQQSRTVQRLLGTEFQVAFADRDSTACRQAIEAGLDLPRLFENDPWLVSTLIEVAHRGVAMQYIRQAVEHDVLSDEDLEAILTRLTTEPRTLDRWSQIIWGERAIITEVANNPNKYNIFDRSGPGQSFQAMLGRASSRDICHLLEYYEKLEALDVSDIDVLVKKASEIDEAVKLQIKDAGILGLNHWRITSAVIPSGYAIVNALVREVVQERFTRHGLAIRLYEKRNGQLPDSLVALREVGLDSMQWKPWGGKPFGYRIEEGDAVLWATIPQDGPITSDQPPEIDGGIGDNQQRKMFYLRIRRIAK
ncbi:MAG: hypothetical protein ACK553_05730 [Planctomycetota bacterium]|jgi:hypothetical protein